MTDAGLESFVAVDGRGQVDGRAFEGHSGSVEIGGKFSSPAEVLDCQTVAMDGQTAESLEIGSYILQLGKSQSEIERSFTILGRLVARHRQIQSISLPIDSQLKNLKNFGGRRM